MKISVSGGAAGLIGSNIRAALLNEETEVIGLDDVSSCYAENLETSLGLTFIQNSTVAIEPTLAISGLDEG